MTWKFIHSMAKRVLANVTIHDVMEAINKRFGNIPALQIKEGDNFRKLSYVELGRRAVDVSSALIKFGLEKGDRVAVLSESRPEWAIACFGIISCAGIIVPIDIKLSEKEIQFILNDSQVKFIFVSEKYLPTIDGLGSVLPYVKKIICMDNPSRNDIVLLKDLKIQKNDKKYNPLYPDDTALIVYTSGTTGVAKGVELSFRNVLFQVVSLSEIVRYNSKDQFLSILPLNHMLEITGGLIAPLYAGSCISYCHSLKTTTLISLMKETHTTAMICVPLVIKMIHDSIIKKIDSLSPIKKKAAEIFMAISKFMLQFNIRVGRFLFRALHNEFGGRFRVFVSGGAPLSPDIELNLNILGFRILQGYGLTETSPVISVNTFKASKIGSVGRPLPGTEVTISKENKDARDGEIITRGPHVMKGYYKNPEKTAEVIKGGWLHTGDIGYFNKSGFLYISGRIRNLIVLGAGKKVFPEEVEEVIGKSPYIKEICVLARTASRGVRTGCEEVYAAIVPNLDFFGQTEKADEGKIRSKIDSEITRLSEGLADYKKIMDFELWKDELPKTATKKIRRNEISRIINNK